MKAYFIFHHQKEKTEKKNTQYLVVHLGVLIKLAVFFLVFDFYMTAIVLLLTRPILKNLQNTKKITIEATKSRTWLETGKNMAGLNLLLCFQPLPFLPP